MKKSKKELEAEASHEDSRHLDTIIESNQNELKTILTLEQDIIDKPLNNASELDDEDAFDIGAAEPQVDLEVNRLASDHPTINHF